MRSIVIFAIVGILITIPVLPGSVQAAGLVPCGGTNEPACQACHVVELGQNILTWGITIMISVIVLIFAWGGLKMVMSAGNTEGVSEAKGMMTNSIIGFIILLSAWLVVDTILKLVLTDDQAVRQKMGMWHTISCVAEPTRVVMQTGGGGTVAPAPSSTGLTASEVRSQLAGIDIVSSGNCYDRTSQRCTGLDGIQQGALTEIKNTITSCAGCNLQITAGTEPGHTNACHVGGTCVDIACKGGCSLDQAKAVFVSATNSGARAVWEGADCGVRDTLRAQGHQAYCKSDAGYGHITGTHFSLYTQ